jgi:hypothetical protein
MSEKNVSKKIDVNDDFDPIEKGTHARRNYSAVLDRCKQFQQQGGLFDAQTERIAETLDISFSLYCDMQSSPGMLDTVFAELEKIQMKPLPSRKKLELLAIKYVTRPRDDRQHEACSRYANVLTWAREKKLTAQNFGETFRTTTLERCIAFARLMRRSQRKPKQATAYIEVRINDAVHERRLLRSRIEDGLATFLWDKLDADAPAIGEQELIQAAVVVLTKALNELKRRTQVNGVEAPRTA